MGQENSSPCITISPAGKQEPELTDLQRAMQKEPTHMTWSEPLKDYGPSGAGRRGGLGVAASSGRLKKKVQATSVRSSRSRRL